MNKNNRKDLLYYEAFKLFLKHQYDGVSLKDIEKYRAQNETYIKDRARKYVEPLYL